MKRKGFTRNPSLSEEGRAALKREVRERIKQVQKEDIEERNPGQIENKIRDINEGEGSAGSLPYKSEYDNIGTSSTGTNIHKDRNLEKSGSGEE